MTQTHRLALPPGTQLRDYQVLGVLGQGGFGITYLGLNTALDQRVAIKEYLPGAFAMRDGNTLSVQPNGADSEQVFHWGLQRFLEEARILARLSHAHIVRVHYFMSLNDTGYMVMEFLEGKTLGDWLKARGASPVTQDAVLRILDPLTDALALVHDNGLAHRDIKPDNVFMRQGTTPVLIDFGAARNVFTGRSQTVAAIVTPGYSPNEQYSGTVNQGPWTDIYTLGAVVYRMVVGDAPADAPSRIAHLMEGRPDPCLRFAEIAGRGFEPAFVQAVDWAMRLRADERPQSVHEWRDALGLGRGAATMPTARDAPATAPQPALPQPRSAPTAPRTAPAPPKAPATNDWAARPVPPTQIQPASPKSIAPLALMIAAGFGVALIAGLAVWWSVLRENDGIGNSVAQAFPLGTLGAQPVTISDSIGGDDPADIVRFDLAADSEVSMSLDGPGQAAALRLVDGDAQPVALLEDGASRLAELRAGRYALEISSRAGYSQRYTLQLQGQTVLGRARPGADPKSALDLAGRGAFDGEAVLYDGRIWPGAREHFFKLRLDRPARVSIILHSAGASGSLSLTDASGIATATRQLTPDRIEPLIQDLAAGDHFIAVGSRGEAPWAYKLKVKIDGLSASRDAVARAPAEEGLSFEAAQILPEPAMEPQSFDVRMPQSQTQRFFALRVSRPGTLSASAAGESFNELELFRADGVERVARAAGPNSISLQSNVSPGAYVLRIGAAASPASGRLALALGSNAVLGAARDQPLVLGAVGARPIEHAAQVRREQPEHWLAFSLEHSQQLVLELTRGDGGPLPKGTMVSLLDAGLDRSRAFITREDGEILSQSVPLESGRYLLKLSLPEGQSVAYALKLFGAAGLEADRAGDSATEPRPLDARAASAVTGVVGGRDGADLFRLRLERGMGLTLQLDELEQNADLAALAEDGRMLAQSRRPDTRMHAIHLDGGQGPVIVKVETASAWLTPYRLRIVPQSPQSTATASSADASADDRIWQSVASVSLKGAMTRQDALRLAKARARAKLIAAARPAGKAAPEAADTASPAQLLAALRDGIPYRETWQAKWLSEDQLAVVLHARLRRPRGDEVLTASLPAARFAAGKRIDVALKATENLRAGLYAWQADATVVRLYPTDASEALTLTAGQKIVATDKLPGGFSSAPMPGAEASEEAIIVLACPGSADFASLAPVPGTTAGTSLSAAVEAPVFLEAMAGLCPGQLVIRVLSYRVDKVSG